MDIFRLLLTALLVWLLVVTHRGAREHRHERVSLLVTALLLLAFVGVSFEVVVVLCAAVGIV